MNLNDTMTENQEAITRLNDVIRILEYDPSTIVRGIDHEE